MQLLADLDSLEKAVDNAQESVTNMTGMVPMIQKQYEDNLEQLEITQENALEAHNQSQTAEKVCSLNKSGFSPILCIFVR